MAETPSHEAAIFCHYILSSLDRLLQCLEGLDEKQLNWQPPALRANSLYALAVHTIGNAEENILCTLCDQAGSRQREQEFLAKGQSAEALVTHWQALRERLRQVLLNLSPGSPGTGAYPSTSRFHHWAGYSHCGRKARC